MKYYSKTKINKNKYSLKNFLAIRFLKYQKEYYTQNILNISPYKYCYNKLIELYKNIE